MLETFRKRDNTTPRAPGSPGSAQPPVRPPLTPPQVRMNENTKSDALQPDAAAARPSTDTVETAKAAEQQSQHTQTQQQATAPSNASTAKLIVGADIKLKGAEINDCDTLIVEGQVDASMASRVIEVAKTGLFRGKVQVEFAEIQGRFEGELTANKQLMIRASGRVSGKIRYGSILIEEGGELSGDVAVSDSNTQRRVSAGAYELGADASRDATGGSGMGRSQNPATANQR